MEPQRRQQSKDPGVKHVLGMPMRWELRNALRNYWNPQDSRVLPPKYFGIGWDLNLHAVAKRLHLVR